MRLLHFAPLPVLLWPLAVAAEEAARPPCGRPPHPAYAAPSDKPNGAVWREGDRAFRACGGWRPGGFSLPVTLAGSFRYQDPAEELLGRFGRI